MDTAWTKTVSCKHTKLFLPTLDLFAGKLLAGLKRWEVNLLIHIVTGHNFLRKHASMLGSETTKIAPFITKSSLLVW